MTDTIAILRKTVTDLLIAEGFERVMIRPNGNVRVYKNSVWTDAGRVGDYASQIADARISTDERAMMNTGYGRLD